MRGLIVLIIFIAFFVENHVVGNWECTRCGEFNDFCSPSETLKQFFFHRCKDKD